MADQCYFNGNFYQCATATTAGESPATAPSKWRMVQIPKEWRDVLARLTYANLLELDGQKEKAEAERAGAETMERNGLQELVRRAANKEQWRERPNVKPPPYPMTGMTFWEAKCKR